jgi:hypothetical protein
LNRWRSAAKSIFDKSMMSAGHLVGGAAFVSAESSRTEVNTPRAIYLSSEPR